MQPGIKPPTYVGGPEIVIVRDGRYADFNEPDRPGHMGGQTLEAGTTIGYPRWYGDSLIESGHAMKLEDYILETFEGEPMLNATDAAVKLAIKHEIDIDSVEGSGKDGRIIMSDIKRLIQE